MLQPLAICVKIAIEGIHMLEVIAPPAIPVGKIKSFGPFGPKYEVGRALRQLEDGDWLVTVMMVETGETAEYRMTRLLDDPEANVRGGV